MTNRNENSPLVLCLSLLAVLLLLLDGNEPEIVDQYPTTKYERCMVLYGDTDQEKECDEFKESVKGRD